MKKSLVSGAILAVGSHLTLVAAVAVLSQPAVAWGADSLKIRYNFSTDDLAAVQQPVGSGRPLTAAEQTRVRERLDFSAQLGGEDMDIACDKVATFFSQPLTLDTQQGVGVTRDQPFGASTKCGHRKLGKLSQRDPQGGYRTRPELSVRADLNLKIPKNGALFQQHFTTMEACNAFLDTLSGILKDFAGHGASVATLVGESPKTESGGFNPRYGRPTCAPGDPSVKGAGLKTVYAGTLKVAIASSPGQAKALLGLNPDFTGRLAGKSRILQGASDSVAEANALITRGIADNAEAAPRQAQSLPSQEQAAPTEQAAASTVGQPQPVSVSAELLSGIKK